MTPEEAFGRALRALREARGLSQERLGLESGYHRNFIGLVERGQLSATIGALFRLARVLQVRPSELIERAEAGADTLPERERG